MATETSDVKFRVTFTDLTDKSGSYASNYDSLFDALTVIKNTSISTSRISYKALTEEQFNEKLFDLLTSGYVHTGPKTHEFPQGTIVIYLTKVDSRSTAPVYAEKFGIHLPQQVGPYIVEYMTSASQHKVASFNDRITAARFVDTCGVENTYMVTNYNFKYDKEEVSN